MVFLSQLNGDMSNAAGNENFDVIRELDEGRGQSPDRGSDRADRWSDAETSG